MTAPEREEDVVAEGATTNQTSEDEEVLLTEEDQEFVEQRVTTAFGPPTLNVVGQRARNTRTTRNWIRLFHCG